VPHRSRPAALHTAGASKKDILELVRANNVRFLRLQFTDILGINKNVEIPVSQIDHALEGQVTFDGSSIEGFVRIEESDMLLAPDFGTFRIFPWGNGAERVARIICDIRTPDGEPFAGDPRGVLARQIAHAKKLGYTMQAFSSKWGSRSRPRTTRSRTASTRSTSAPRMRSPPPTTSRRSDSW